jgi:putative ABC transport system permease protein
MIMNLRRLTGMSTIATVALAVLVFGCVLAATAGPREALATRTQALHQTLAATPSVAQSVTATSTWSDITGEIESSSFKGSSNINLTDSDIGDITSQLHGDFNRGVVHLSAPAADWAGMTSAMHPVLSTLAPVDGTAVRMEVAYRLPLTKYLKVISGSLTPSSSRTVHADSSGYASTIQVAITQQTARRFALRAGSSVVITGPQLALSGDSATITLKVAAIVAQRSAASTFWTADPTVAAPSLDIPSEGRPYWTSGAFALPGEIDAVQQDFGPEGLSMQWTFPMGFGTLSGDQAQPLYDALNKLAAQTPALTGQLAPAENALQVSSGLSQALSGFISAASAVDVLLWLLYVSLGVAGLVVLLLAARMIALRRAAELTLRRARGASLPQIALAAGRGAAVACLPAAVLGVVVAILLVRDESPPGGWWPGVATLVVALGAPAVVAAWQQRLPRSGKAARGRARRRGGVRLVAEVTACAAAIAGLIVFRQQGTQAGSGVNLYTSAAPVLVAVPIVIVVGRLYPLVLRGLLRASSRGRGATGFVGLARAMRAALSPALPAFALVIAVTIAAFAGMVRDAVTQGEVNASWQAAGADVTVSTTGPLNSSGPISAAAQRAIAAVPGVQRSAIVTESTWTAPNDQQVTGLAVDPASYAALVASTQTWPAVNPALLGGAATGASRAAQPVLASPQAVTALGGRGTATLTTASGNPPVQVHVTGVLSGTPALPGGGAFVIMPLSAIRSQAGLVPNVMLLTGSSINLPRLDSVAGRVAPGAGTTARSGILATLTGAPLQQGTFLLFVLAVVVAAGFGLAVMLLELAFSAADREATLARLATMGLGEGQRTRLVLLEVLPAVIAAAAAATVSALLLPRVVAPAIDLSVFTGTSAGVPLVPDVVSFAVPLAGLAVVTCLALAVEIRAGRRGVTASLRGGE